MIYGIGTDIFEVTRIKKAIAKDDGFLNSIFSAEEIAYCESLKSREQNYAARFSAKEAFMKAIGTGWRYGIKFTDIIIRNDELGKPYFQLTGKASEVVKKNNICEMHLTLSHTKKLAMAIVILENKPEIKELL